MTNVNMATFITELQYFPSIIYFLNLIDASDIIFDQYESYQKMSFRNRTMVAGANGAIILSVPLTNGRNQKGLMKDIRIANQERWQIMHLKTILSCYNRSPWFEHYQDEFCELYRKPFNFLVDWDFACFEWSIEKLGLPWHISLNGRPGNNKEEDGYKNKRNLVSPKNYRDFKPLNYRQVFEENLGFLPNLSILDLLFCEGSMAGVMLKQHISNQI